MALIDHRTVEEARGTPTASDAPASERGSNGTSPARGNGVAPQKPRRPAPPTTKQGLTARAVANKVDEPALERDEAPGNGWTLFLGAIIVLALMKEILGRMSASPVTVRAKSVSRSVSRHETAFSIAALVGTIGRIGARVLGSRALGI